jgi:hypothetical protein
LLRENVGREAKDFSGFHEAAVGITPFFSYPTGATRKFGALAFSSQGDQLG